MAPGDRLLPIIRHLSVPGEQQYWPKETSVCGCHPTSSQALIPEVHLRRLPLVQRDPADELHVVREHIPYVARVPVNVISCPSRRRVASFTVANASGSSSSSTSPVVVFRR